MKILHICNDYRDKNLYSKMFNEISNRNIEQDVFVPFKAHLKLDMSKKYRITHTLSYKNIDRIFFRRKSKKIFNDLIKSQIDLKSINVIHAHTLFSNGYIAYLLNKRFNKEYIVTVRGTDVEIFFKKFFWLRKLGEKILVNAKNVIFLTDSLKIKTLDMINEDASLKVEEKSFIIPNGVDDYWFDNQGTKMMSRNDEINVIQVGWIKPNKNQKGAIETIKLMREKDISINLKIVGGIEYEKDEIYYKELKKYIEEKNLHNYIDFTGKLNKEKLSQELNRADIFLLPSFSETFGLVYIEAMTQGLPIIYSANTGVDGLFKDNPVGEAVLPNEVDSIYQGLVNVIENYDVYAGNTIKNINNFRWSTIIDRINRVYNFSDKTDD